jgi:hypothetical protein
MLCGFGNFCGQTLNRNAVLERGFARMKMAARGRLLEIAAQLPFGLIEHIRRKRRAIARCLPSRAEPNLL